MAHLASSKVESAQNLAAQDNAAANAGTQRDNNGILEALCAACDVFAKCCCVGIVFHIDLAAKQSFQVRPQSRW